MKKPVLSRREFNVRCATLALSLSTLSGAAATRASAFLLDTQDAANGVAGPVKLPDGTSVSPLGQGCWHLGQGRHPEDVEQEALRTGISNGMTLIDTSGNYGHGRSEEFVGRAIAGMRDRIFLVSKVEGDEVAGDGIARACAASLKRLGTDYLDLYLMHWPVPSAQLPGMVSAFEQLRAAKKIRAWGVSNFGVPLMEDMFRLADGHRCATNQVPYSLNNRSVERDVLPWCKQHGMPIMAYSPLGGDNSLVLGNHVLGQVAASHGCSAAGVALAWVIRGGNVIAIPESGSPTHVKENAQARSVTLTEQDLKALDVAFPSNGASR